MDKRRRSFPFIIRRPRPLSPSTPPSPEPCRSIISTFTDVSSPAMKNKNRHKNKNIPDALMNVVLPVISLTSAENEAQEREVDNDSTFSEDA